MLGIGTWRCGLDLSPEQLAERIGRWREPVLLESGPGFGKAGRWSLFAAEPTLVFEAIGGQWTLNGPGLQVSGHDPLKALGRVLRKWLPVEAPNIEGDNAPPFLGGFLGFIGYDLAPSIEHLPRRAPRDSRIPDIRLGLYETFAAVDHDRGEASLWTVDLTRQGEATIAQRLDLWRNRLSGEQPQALKPSRLSSPVARISRTEYLAKVRRVLDYISSGHIFQVNLSQCFEARGSVDPLELYHRLKQRSPAPFAAFLQWDDLAVISSSPEWFFEVRDRRIVTRPIKGTRPRGQTPAEDARLIEELRNSPKDRAELTMIVDLERNDLGRVCEFESVRVLDPMTVETFAQVHHLVATVEGRLRPEVGPVDLIRALFPGGSITGAPKIRAMEIIDELEPNRRSLYTGSIGYFSAGGAAQFNIAIRTILVEGDRLRYQVGGGIVAESQPEAEYEETLHKGRALREVIESFGIQEDPRPNPLPRGEGAKIPLSPRERVTAQRPGEDPESTPAISTPPQDHESMIWVSDQIISDHELRISARDRTFEHGLGLFETFRTWNGHATLLDRHLNRLLRSAEVLRLPVDPSDLPDAEAVASLLQANGHEGDALLRLTVSGGLSETEGATAWLRLAPLPPEAPEGGLRVTIARAIQVGPCDPLAAHKSLNYWRLRLAFEEARAEGFDEAITTGLDGTLLEGTRTNLFFVRDGTLITPPLDGRLLPGLMRQIVLERAGAIGVEVREIPQTVGDAESWDEAFLTNAVRGIMPIGSLAQKTWNGPGPITKRLAADLQTWLESGGSS